MGDMTKLSYEDRVNEADERAEEFIEELEARYDVTYRDTDDADEWFTSAYHVFWASAMRLMAYGWTVEDLKKDVDAIAETNADIMRKIEKIEAAERSTELMLKLGAVKGGLQ